MQENISSHIDMVLSNEFYAYLVSFIYTHHISRKSFLQRGLRNYTLSMKITFFFHNFYYILHSRNTTIELTILSWSQVLQLCLSSRELEPSLVAMNLLKEGTLSCFVLLNVEVLVNVYMYITCNNGHPNMALCVCS